MFDKLQSSDFIIALVFLVLFIFFISFKRLTKNGLFIFLVSYILLIANFFLKNFFLYFFSLSILFIFSSFFLFCLLFSFKKREFSIIAVDYETITPDIEIPIKVKFNREFLKLHFFDYYVKYEVFDGDKLIDSNFTYSSVEKYDLLFYHKFVRHGEFTIKNIKIILSDILGFTQYVYNVKDTINITVYPVYENSIKVPMLTKNDGDEILQNVLSTTSTDFFENRKYYPGDDPRRINWKIFAHTNELHVRELERIPPKIGQITVIFAPYSNYIAEYKGITSIFVSTMRFLLERGVALCIRAPLSEKSFLISKDNEDDFNKIINFSFSPIKYEIGKVENAVIFASFYQYIELLEYNRFKDSFLALSYFVPEIKKINLSLFSFARESDSFVEDLLYNFKLNSIVKRRGFLLEAIKRNSSENRIKLEIYKQGNDVEK